MCVCVRRMRSSVEQYQNIGADGGIGWQLDDCIFYRLDSFVFFSAAGVGANLLKTDDAYFYLGASVCIWTDLCRSTHMQQLWLQKFLCWRFLCVERLAIIPLTWQQLQTFKEGHFASEVMTIRRYTNLFIIIMCLGCYRPRCTVANREQKCAENYNKWHNKIIFLNCNQHFVNFKP